MIRLGAVLLWIAAAAAIFLAGVQVGIILVHVGIILVKWFQKAGW